MKTRITILITFCLLLSTVSAHAQKLDTIAIVSYIKLYKDIAVSEMKRTGIPASITLAQGIHESGFGKSFLAQNTNNHFGIKCKEEWKGKTFKYTDDAPNECFRVYDNVEDSYKDHSDFLKNRPRYAALFLLDKNDYKGWSFGLKKAGYATNPAYPQILIKMIEDFELAAFDKGNIPSYISPLQKTIVIEKDNAEEYNVTDSMQIDVQKTIIIEKQKEVYVPTNTVSLPQSQQPVTTKKVNKSIFKVNDCKTVKIYTSKGETLDLIGNILKIEKEDLLIYNDITNESIIKEGQTIFIQQKKKSNKAEPTYKVKQEDNMWSISQKKGVRLAALLKMNKLVQGEEPEAKQTIVLKGKAKEKPVLRSNIKTETPKPSNSLKREPQYEKSPLGDLVVVRARDTIYPTIKEETKLSVDSNKTLGWETETKLLEKATLSTFTANDIVKTEPVNKETPVVATIISEKETPTVYPKVIDYNKLPKSSTDTHTVVKGDTMYNICKRYTITIAQITEWNNLTDQSVRLGQVLKIQP